jgi:hypothetical protein
MDLHEYTASILVSLAQVAMSATPQEITRHDSKSSISPFDSVPDDQPMNHDSNLVNTPKLSCFRLLTLKIDLSTTEAMSKFLDFPNSRKLCTLMGLIDSIFMR